MKKRILVSLVVALCASSVWAQGAQPIVDLPKPPIPPGLTVPADGRASAALPKLDSANPLSIEDALKVAFEHNPDIKIALDVAQRAVGVVAEAQSNFNPKFNATLAHIVQPETTSSFGGSGAQPAQKIVIQQAQATNASVVATLPLDISRRFAYTSDVAKYQFDIAYLNMVAASEKLIQNVKVAYYDLLRACGQARVAQAAVDVAKVRFDNTKARFDAGTVPKFDVLTAEVDVSNLHQLLIQAQTRVEVARSTFNRQLGIDINSQTQVQDVAINVQQPRPGTDFQGDLIDADFQGDQSRALEQISRAIRDQIDADIKTAYARRPEIRLANTAIELNKKNVKLQQTGLKPSLNFNLNMGYNVNTTAFTNQNVNWQTSLVVSRPLWDGGLTKARVAEAKADVANATDTLDQTKLAVGFDVRNSVLSLDEAAKRTQTTASAVSLAEEALRLANVRYEAGIAVLVEVTNAESQLTQAKFNYVNAQYDYAAALATLQRATSTQPERNQVQLLNNARLRR
ncbi:MAG: TolC family protein [Armatimonadetes bacterium]|nr:TolC family protein [Armatimonadota bacterium]